MVLGLLLVLAGTGCRSLQPLAPSTTPEPTRVDVLAYLLGDPALWPRHGDQAQHQIIGAQQVCWVKYGRAEMFECWRWDEQYIYHQIDRALDGETGESYSFTDGRWLPRYLEPGVVWGLDLPENRVHWWTRDCRVMPAREGLPDPSGVHLFPYRMRAWLEPATDLGGDLGVREVLVLTYAGFAPGQEPGEPEVFRFAKGAGWYAWSSPRGSRSWRRVGGPAVMPSSSGCRLPAPAAPAW